MARKATTKAAVNNTTALVVAGPLVAHNVVKPVSKPVVNTMTRMRQRVAALLAERAARNAARSQARDQRTYMLAVQQLAAEYNMPVPNTMSVRPFNKPQQHAPSAVQGACAVVHALADQYQDRATTLAACKEKGINPATAATQYAKWKKLQKAAAIAELEADSGDAE